MFRFDVAQVRGVRFDASSSSSSSTTSVAGATSNAAVVERSAEARAGKNERNETKS